MVFFRLTGVTFHERLALTELLQEALGRCSCWITDSHLYSNLSLCLTLEAPRDRLTALVAQLRQLPIRFSAEELAAMEALAAEEGAALGTLQLTFVHDDPDLRRQVPPIPG